MVRLILIYFLKICDNFTFSDFRLILSAMIKAAQGGRLGFDLGRAKDFNMLSCFGHSEGASSAKLGEKHPWQSAIATEAPPYRENKYVYKWSTQSQQWGCICKNNWLNLKSRAMLHAQGQLRLTHRYNMRERKNGKRINETVFLCFLLSKNTYYTKRSTHCWLNLY